MTRRGLVALGDSITNGHGEPALGVTMQSWAQWVAEALGLPFTKLARDGALARDVLAEQVPRLEGPYDVACLYVGVNDARSTEWDAGAYGEALRATASALAACSERLLLCTLPADLGRPRPGRRNAPVLAHRDPRLAPRPRPLHRPLGRSACARRSPSRGRARPRAAALSAHVFCW